MGISRLGGNGSGRSRWGFSALTGALVTGLLYGVAMYLIRGSLGDYIYLRSPLMFAVLGGVLTALVLRPVLVHLPFSHGARLALALAMLVGVGATGEWLLAWLLEAANLGVFPLHLPPTPLPFLGAALVAGAAMAWFYRGRERRIDLANLRVRWQRRPTARRAPLALAMALGLVGLWLLVAYVDGRLEETSAELYIPRVEQNTWLMLEGIWLRAESPGGLLGGLLLVGVLLLRALLLITPLLPVLLCLRGRWSQLTLVLAMIVFVINDFAPLMLQQPYPSYFWLFSRTLLGAGQALVIGGALAWGFGVLRSAGEDV